MLSPHIYQVLIYDPRSHLLLNIQGVSQHFEANNVLKNYFPLNEKTTLIRNK